MQLARVRPKEKHLDTYPAHFRFYKSDTELKTLSHKPLRKCRLRSRSTCRFLHAHGQTFMHRLLYAGIFVRKAQTLLPITAFLCIQNVEITFVIQATDFPSTNCIILTVFQNVGTAQNGRLIQICAVFQQKSCTPELYCIQYICTLTT